MKLIRAARRVLHRAHKRCRVRVVGARRSEKKLAPPVIARYERMCDFDEGLKERWTVGLTTSWGLGRRSLGASSAPPPQTRARRRKNAHRQRQRLHKKVPTLVRMRLFYTTSKGLECVHALLFHHHGANAAADAAAATASLAAVTFKRGRASCSWHRPGGGTLAGQERAGQGR